MTTQQQFWNMVTAGYVVLVKPSAKLWATDALTDTPDIEIDELLDEMMDRELIFVK